ncbi:MAG: phosphoribosylformylglycinamidine synthase [Cyclobacteriaceae bacterium]|nr:phosphoribosylformylglycinamidine synthase [Cyclobacteriaceae bacterium]UYN86005.1 MAG: phosphoribosylformylglycinamidine synthase [Cyclobacteriaceae bacterium]
MKVKSLLAFGYLLCAIECRSQEYDSATVAEEKKLPYKVLHAEPLYIDLIRDLGAHKGEKEWNLGFGMKDKLRFDQYEALIEYEWAPANRLGLEVEVPVTFYMRAPNGLNAEKPSHRIESIKTAAQWTFLVSRKFQTSLALGYLNEIEFTDLNRISTKDVFQGNLFNPFFIVAKRWGDWHTLVYTGPKVHFHFENQHWSTEYDINSNIHYMIPGTRNFIGIEFNKMFGHEGLFEMVIRPQMRVVIHDALMIGIVQGIPVSKERERLSSFLRLIYEPQHTLRAKNRHLSRGHN